MPNIPNNFNGSKFAEKYALRERGDFYDDGNGVLVCPSLPNLTDADLLDCVIDPWSIVRDQRVALLKQCDWTQLLDAALTLEERSAWAEYRQALRDIPQTFLTPAEVVYPVKPGGA